jgi:TonB family protein
MNHKKLLIALLLLLAGLTFAQQREVRKDALQGEPGRPASIRVAEGVMAGNLIHRVVPDYPEAARSQGIKGTVVVNFHVDKQGNVGPPLVANGDPLLRDAAIDTVKQWRFEPYLLKGEPVEVDTLATMQFPPVQVPKRIRVSQGVMAGNLQHKVNPKYPPEAKAAKIQGDVILQVRITPEGKVFVMKAISGDPLLVEATTNAVVQWKYKPYELNGEPLEVETTVRVEFHL